MSRSRSEALSVLWLGMNKDPPDTNLQAFCDGAFNHLGDDTVV